MALDALAWCRLHKEIWKQKADRCWKVWGNMNGVREKEFVERKRWQPPWLVPSALERIQYDKLSHHRGWLLTLEGQAAEMIGNNVEKQTLWQERFPFWTLRTVGQTGRLKSEFASRRHFTAGEINTQWNRTSCLASAFFFFKKKEKKSEAPALGPFSPSPQWIEAKIH